MVLNVNITLPVVKVIAKALENFQNLGISNSRDAVQPTLARANDQSRLVTSSVILTNEQASGQEKLFAYYICNQTGMVLNYWLPSDKVFPIRGNEPGRLLSS